MIPKELKEFIEQNCSGIEPSDFIMEAIGNKIENLGADPDEVLAFVEECSKGPTLEEKEEAKRRANALSQKETNDFVVLIEGRLAEIKACSPKEYDKNKAILESELRKAKNLYSDNAKIQEIVKEIEREIEKKELQREKASRNKITLFSIIGLILIVCGYYGYQLYQDNVREQERIAFEKSPKHLIDLQCDSLCSIIDQLESPTMTNYQVQKRQIQNIQWTRINSDWKNKDLVHYETNKEKAFNSKVRNYTKQLVEIFQCSKGINAPHQEFESGFNNLKEYDGLYNLLMYGYEK